MKTSKTILTLAVALMAQLAHGEMGNGTYTISLGSTVRLWDISGKYDLTPLLPYTNILGARVTSGGGYSMSVEPSGKFQSGANINYDDQIGNSVDGNVSVNGLVKDSRVKMKIQLSGSLILGSGLIANYDFNASAMVVFGLDSSGHRLFVKSGTARLLAKDLSTGKKISRSFHIPGGTLVTLPVKVTGDWNLNLQLTPNGKTYAATGTVETSTGKTLSLTGTGVYRANTDTSRILLKGPSSMLNLVISTSGTNVVVESMVGKLYGQSIKF